MRHTMWLARSGLVLLLLLGSSVATGEEPVRTQDVRVHRHAIRVRLDPARHRLLARDEMEIVGRGRQSIRFDLAPDLELTALEIDGTATALPERDEHGRFSLDLAPGKLVIGWKGRIYDQVKKSDDLAWVVGDGTRGVIAEQGVFLSGSSRWIPTPVQGLPAHYDLEVYAPQDMVVVSQGHVPERKSVPVGPTADPAKDWIAPEAFDASDKNPQAPLAWSRWRSALPTDSLSLSAGPYVVKSREVEGVTISTYFYKQDAGAADLWLSEMAATVKRYKPLLGKLPFPKFDIVSNFFQSGYGMPSYTLLGDRVIRYVTMKAQRTGSIPPGYLDHEYVHCWFGNGLFVDYAKGNWCEAITTYYANYLAKELESRSAGHEHRRATLEKFCLRVHGAADYPLVQFRSKVEQTDNEVGYGKGSMLFHMVRRRLGDEVFFPLVKRFTQSHLGEVATWRDWQDLFGEAGGPSLARDLDVWIRRRNLPVLKIAHVAIKERTDAPGHVLRLGLTQTTQGGAWPLDVPVHITLKDGTETIRIARFDHGVRDAKAQFELPSEPVFIRVDPDHDLARRIAAKSLPQCLNATMESLAAVQLLPGAEATCSAIAERFARERGVPVVRGELPPEIAEGGIIRFRVLDDAAASSQVAGTDYAGPNVSTLVSTFEDGRSITTYTAHTAEAARRVHYIPYYGWNTWLAFDSGRPVARGTERAPEAELVWGTPPAEQKSAADEALDKRLGQLVDHLLDAKFEGRRPGTAGHTAIAKDLEKRLREAGASIVLGKERFRLTSGGKLPRGLAGGVPDVEGHNVVGAFGGKSDPTGAPTKAWLLMAHYDALGAVETEQGTKEFRPGADDNASGVATLLALLPHLAAFDKQSQRTTILVAFTDAEEWGLVGARALAPVLAKRYDLQGVVNVDSVGRAGSGPIHVIGVSRHPTLAKDVTAALENAGLTLGKNIDQYAYKLGSDHWPFHEAGVPALSLWASDYRRMNTKDDTREHVETNGMVGIVKALRTWVDGRLPRDGR